GPYRFDALPLGRLLFGRESGFTEPAARRIQVDGGGAGALPELKSAVPAYIVYQVNGDAHQPGLQAGVAAEIGPGAMGFEEAILGDRFGGILVAQRSESEAENSGAI